VNDTTALSSKTTWELIWLNDGHRHTQEFSDQEEALLIKQKLEQEGFEVEMVCLAKLFG
jgi:hypothetical protein